MNMVANPTDQAPETAQVRFNHQGFRLDADGKIDDKPRELHVRIPAHVCPAPGSGFDLLGLEDWIVGAFFVNYLRLWGSPPCVSELQEVSGRSYDRVVASLKRMQARGWIGMKKLRNEYAPGQYGYRWRIWLNRVSPLRELRDARKGDGFRWIAVPAEVARSRSPLDVAVYLVCHEQKRLDGGVTTTPADLAAILGCDRTTAWRTLKRIGAIAVTDGKPGNVVYDLPLVFDRKASATIPIAGHMVPVHGDQKRLGARFALLIRILDNAFVDVERDAGIVIAQLVERGVDVRLDLVIRILEQRHRRVLMRSADYRHRLVLRFGTRLRAGMRRLTRAEEHTLLVHADENHAEREALRVAVRDALSHTCSTCDDTRLVIERQNGGDVGVPCPACRT